MFAQPVPQCGPHSTSCSQRKLSASSRTLFGNIANWWATPTYIYSRGCWKVPPWAPSALLQRGVFSPPDKKIAQDDPYKLDESWRGEWENYISTEDDPDTVYGILNALVNEDKADCFDLSQGEEPAGSTVANRLGLLCKVKPDGTLK